MSHQIPCYCEPLSYLVIVSHQIPCHCEPLAYLILPQHLQLYPSPAAAITTFIFGIIFDFIDQLSEQNHQQKSSSRVHYPQGSSSFYTSINVYTNSDAVLTRRTPSDIVPNNNFERHESFDTTCVALLAQKLDFVSQVRNVSSRTTGM